MWLSFAVLIAACSAALPPRTNQDPGDAAAKVFDEADINGDGVLHLLEMVQLFERYDADGNKRVTKTEYTTFIQNHEPDLLPLAGPLFDVLDHDGDRTLELSDFMHLYLQMTQDVNDDEVSKFTFVGYFTVLYTNLLSN